MGLDDIGAIVVHHRNYAAVSRTVERLLDEGLEPAQILVVDNSEEPLHRLKLRACLPAGCNILFAANRGYGAAVNSGVAAWADAPDAPDYVVVATHEALPETGAIGTLLQTMQTLPSAAIVGPKLVTGDNSELIWSEGGRISARLGMPRHDGHLQPRSQSTLDAIREVAWVDGAFFLARRTVLEDFPFDEDFFLYVEETHLQLRLRAAGWHILVNSGAVVWQSSNGAPAYYRARNIQLLHTKLGAKLKGLIAASFIVATCLMSNLTGRNAVPDWQESLRGWWAGARYRPSTPSDCRAIIVNPLGGALAHYTAALSSNLGGDDGVVRILSQTEPCVSGRSRYSWLFCYVRLLLKAGRLSRRNSIPVLIAWPVVGFWEIVLVRLCVGSEGALIIHDPVPLVAAVGHGRKAVRLIRWSPLKAQVIVHSARALAVMRELQLDVEVRIMPHPMLPPVEGTKRQGRRVVRVLGQYKVDRDLDALRQIAADHSGEVSYEIYGRGWPQVEGWEVNSAYLEEARLNELIESSDVVVVPYRRFYQSGIAFRCIELGTPIVGPGESSLDDVFGSRSPLLVNRGHIEHGYAWKKAIDYAFEYGHAEVPGAAADWYVHASSSWLHWLGDQAVFSGRDVWVGQGEAPCGGARRGLLSG